jgi:hypothetical protein
MIVLLSVPVAGWFFARLRRGSAHREDVLLVVALLALFRCLLDPWNIDYYHVPLIVSLASWEVVARARPPVLSLAATAAVFLSFSVMPSYGDLVYAVYMGWALPLGWLMVRELRAAPAPSPAGARAIPA